MVGDLIGGLALFAALGALALAGSALSKIDKQFKELVLVQINPLRDRIMEIESVLEEYKKGFARLDNENQNIKKIQDDTYLAISQVHEAIESLGKTVAEVSEKTNSHPGMKRRVGRR